MPVLIKNKMIGVGFKMSGCTKKRRMRKGGSEDKEGQEGVRRDKKGVYKKKEG
jgi:hypothetical protein